jgi:hypothetical protein
MHPPTHLLINPFIDPCIHHHMTYRTAPGSGDPLAVSPILEASDYEGTCHMMMMMIMMTMMMVMMMMAVMIVMMMIMMVIMMMMMMAMMVMLVVMMMMMIEMMSKIECDPFCEDSQSIVQYLPSEVMTTIRCESFENAHTDRPSMPA